MKRSSTELEENVVSNIDREWRYVKQSGLKATAEKLSWCQERIKSFLHQTKFVEILSNEFKTFSDGLSEDISKMSEDVGVVMTQKRWLFQDNLENWYNYFVAVRDEIEFAKLGIVVRKHHTKDTDVLRGIFNRSDIRQDDFESVVFDSERVWRTNREMTQSMVKTDQTQFPTHARPLIAPHVSELLMRRLMDCPDLLPDSARERLKSAFSRLKEADYVMWSSLREVNRAMLQCQMMSKKIEINARMGGFAFVMHWVEGNVRTDLESFHFQIANCMSINNPLMSRQVPMKDTYVVSVTFEHVLHQELKSYDEMQKEASVWLADGNGVSFPTLEGLDADESFTNYECREYK